MSKANGHPQNNDELAIDAPIPMAHAFAHAVGVDGSIGVRRHREQWYLWNETAYEPVSEEAVANAIYRFLTGKRVKSPVRSKEGKDVTYIITPKRSVVYNIIDALKSVVEVAQQVPLPAWLDGDRTDPRQWIVFQNGMLNIRRYLKDGDTTLRPHTTAYFNTTALPFDFKPGQKCPTWIRFLDDVFEGDAERVALLQQWIGYCLTDVTKYQKMMVMVGKPRSGKGTILRTITQLVGDQNVATPSLSTLGTGFGFHSMMHARAVLFGDAHLGYLTDVDRVMESIKRITGEDPVNIERKHAPDIIGVRLRCKLTMAANAIPDLPDPSAAIVTRLLLLPFDRSFVGHEDIHLERRLNAEIGGILCWALEGLAQLDEQEAFTRPERSKVMAEELRHEISPIRSFIRDRLVTRENVKDFNADVTKISASAKELWAEWKDWCTENGHKVGSMIGFAKKLLSAVEGVSKAYRGSRAQREWHYEGVATQKEVVQSLHMVESI